MSTPSIDSEFLDAWRGLGASGDGREVLEALRAAWAGPARTYHNLQHLEECLDLARTYRALAQHPWEIVVALWFHDAIYDPRRRDNEEQSAEWAARALREAGADHDATARIHAHILATRHDAEPEPGDQSLLIDIDLAILGAGPERFAEYERQVRAEYAWVPRLLFRRKRRQVLRTLAARVPLYRTPPLRARFEAAARANLAAALG